jgi:hypothetical protein
MDTTKTPRELAEERLQEAYDIATLGEMLVDVYKEKAKLWPEFRSEAKSTVEADRKWEMTEQGLLEKEIKIKMKVKEHKISAIRTYLEVLNNESRNQY